MRDIAPNETGKIEATFNTSGRNGKQQEAIFVHTNDPQNPQIKLLILAVVEDELSVDPRTVYFRGMKKGEKRDQRALVKNMSGKTLRITSIEANDTQVGVDFIDHAKKIPIDLKPNETLDLLISIHYQWDEGRIARNLKIAYTGGEVHEANVRIYAELQREAPVQQKPQENKPAQGNTPQPQPVAPNIGGKDGH